MSEPPAIDVVMPLRNGENFVGAAIASILSQSHENLRLYVVDDASDDASRSIAAALALQDSRVAVLSNAGTGIVAALTTGIAEGDAPLIARMDADDVSLPRRLELQSDFLTKHRDTALVGGRANVIDAKGRVFRQLRYPTLPDEIDSRILTDVCFASPTMLFRRDALAEIGGFRGIFEPAEDVDVALRLAERYAVANLDEVVVCYRVHGQNISGARLRRQWQALIVAQADAATRRTTHTPPAAGSLEELQHVLGVRQADIDRQTFLGALSRCKLLAEVGLTTEAAELLEHAAGLGGDGVAQEEIVARVEATRKRLESIRREAEPGLFRRMSRRLLRVPASRALNAAVRRWPRSAERAAKAYRLLRAGGDVLRRQGPAAFVEAVKAWVRDR